MTPFAKERLAYTPKVPKLLHHLPSLQIEISRSRRLGCNEKNPAIDALFPHTSQFLPIKFIENSDPNGDTRKKIKVAVVFSGGQAPGGHNVVAGLFDALKLLNSESSLIGFLQGPEGILKNNYIEITENTLLKVRNQGGFDLLGSGRTKIETEEQFSKACEVARSEKLDGLVIIGGDDSNTNAAFLAEYFLQQGIATKIIGIPKTIDGDLKNEDIQISFGFDTASKIFSNLIGNIQRDALSAKKYTHFIKLMGRSASHIALECALKAQPNLTIIGEEVEDSKKSLQKIIQEISDLIVERSKVSKNYGVIVIPEGLLEFCDDCKALIKELNLLVDGNIATKSEDEKIHFAINALSEKAKECFSLFPKETQLQLLLERDPHGNINVSKIETEQLVIKMVESELKKRKKNGSFTGKFSPQPHFYGYEGRAATPTNFDANYCYTLGNIAALLLAVNQTGYMACVKNLHLEVEAWEIGAVPLTSMLHIEERQGKEKAVIKKKFVDLKGAPFKDFEKNRVEWSINDHYLFPEPIQFFGPSSIIDGITKTLELESI